MIVSHVRLTPNENNTEWAFETLDGIQTIKLWDRSEDGKHNQYTYQRTPRSAMKWAYDLETLVEALREELYHVIGDDGVAVFMTEEEYEKAAK